MTLPISISGFHIVPITYSSSSTHYLYIRSHTGPKKNSQNVLPNGRTLFLVNVPPDATERQVSLLFKHCGTVEKVVFDLDAVELHHENDEDEDEDVEMEEGPTEDETQQRRKRRKVAKNEAPKVVALPSTSLRTLRPTGRTAHLIFLDSSSLDRALSTSSKPRAWPLKTTAADDEEPSGLAHYAALYDSLRPPLDAVREHADTSVSVYEHELEKTKQRSKYRKGEAIVDDDGFMLVTRGGAYGKTLGGGVGVASKGFQRTGQTSKRSRGAKKEKEKKEKVDFYGFQKAEKQRKVLMDLQRKWEEDKAKVEALKASRKFKPY